ncbi:uncharacterized protein LOC127881237 [Dreissena polymorpha]|uniref:uncharacterized protein LOC127881237 n=1 Tax=Dreissena polymorpha TaxID=45954 RepID=UPI0022654207|nr:uncharacterized protein LOC127881237 [Dreissena polymorpha]
MFCFEKEAYVWADVEQKDAFFCRLGFYADDLAVIADSLEECLSRLKGWKYGMDSKGLRVNMKKTKLLITGPGLNLLRDAGEYPCTASRPIDGRPVTQVVVDGSQLDVEASFCYLGDTLCAEIGCELAIITRCCTAWGKFKKLLPILTLKHVSLKTCGKVFNARVRSAMLHGSDAWAPSASDLQRLRRNDRAMARWICSVKPDDGVDTDTLYGKLGIPEVTASLRTRRLRWYGYVERATSCINPIMKMAIPGARGRERPRKSWSDCIREDLHTCGMGNTCFFLLNELKNCL